MNKKFSEEFGNSMSFIEQNDLYYYTQKTSETL